MIVLVRHGETAWSKARRHTGRSDLPLIDEGRDRARTLPPRLAPFVFAEVRSSPLARARETAELAGLAIDRFDDRLLEWDYGDYEGLTTPEIVERRGAAWDLWTEGAPGGEAPQDVQDRCDALIAELADRARGENLCLVAHGHLLRALGARWLEQPLSFGARLKLDTTGVCVLDREKGERAILQWNVLR